MTARRIGPGPLLGCLVLGVALGERAGPSPAGEALGVGALLVMGAVVAALRRRGIVGLALCGIGFVLLGGAVMCRALDGLVDAPMASAVLDRADAWVDVTLTTDPEATRFSAEALATVERYAEPGGPVRDGGGRTVVIDAASDAGPRLAVLAAGDRVRFDGYFRPLDEFETHRRWRHAVGAFAAGDLHSYGDPGPWLRVANAARRAVLAGHRRLPEPERALVAGFLLGDTAALPDEVVDDFRLAGMTHLLAVSGQNVAFVLALAAPVVRRGPRAVRLVSGLVILGWFATMTRFEPSVLRASAMAACSMSALTAGRPTTALRALTLATIGLLLVDPFLVHSVGFVLSCAASAGIALLAPRIAARIPGPRILAEAIGVALGAQIAVAPVLVTVFDGVPLIAIPANIAAAPLAGPLTVCGIVGGLVGGALGGPVAAAASLPAFVCAAAVRTIAQQGARSPLMVQSGELLAGLVVFVGATLWMRRARRATWRRASARPSRSPVAVPAGRHGARAVVPDARDGDPEPHARLLLRPRGDVLPRRLRAPSRGARTGRRRRVGRGRGEGRTGSGGE